MSIKLLKKHFEEAQRAFPKLQCHWYEKDNVWVVHGDLDIVDDAGIYRGTFTIAVTIDENYPFTKPSVFELSKNIKRDIAWHMGQNGWCCLDIPHKLLAMAKKGIHIGTFIRDVVYPYFANQLYKKIDGDYANGEWEHGDDGRKQLYREEFDIHEPQMAITFLDSVKNHNLPGRNDLCICKEEKFKKCLAHVYAVQTLIRLPKEQIAYDLEMFRKELKNNTSRVETA